MTLRELQERIHSDDTAYTRQFGMDAGIVEAKKQLTASVLETFKAHFQSVVDREVAVYSVPGRLEVLGKHTDYAGGHSLLAAIDRGFIAISALNETGAVRVVENDPTFAPTEFPLSADLTPIPGEWMNYPMTTVKRLMSNFGGHVSFRGVDVAFGSDLPVGGGMSGSSALMIMTFFAIAGPNRLFEDGVFQKNIRNTIDLSMYLACAENGQTFRELTGGKGVGTFGGSEDHTEILNGRPEMLSIFQFCPTVHKADIGFPEELTIAIAYSGVRAEKTREAMALYNLVSRRAGLVVEVYNGRYRTSYTLMRDLYREEGGLTWERDGERIDRIIERIKDAAEAHGADSEELDLPGRFRQFAEEDRRIIPDAARALIVRNVDRLGALIDQSHDLSQTYLRNIVPEVDFLQRTARELGAVAASGFGAGFGGSVYAMIKSNTEGDFLKRWREAYQMKYPEPAKESRFFITRPAGCAGPIFA
jgi:galactokinase